MRIGIVGLGTIGGSFAKAIRAAGIGHELYGADRNEDAVAFARFSDVIDGVLDESTAGSCDLLILALYPESTIAFLQTIAPHIKKDAIVMDCCGIKRAIFDRCVSLAKKHGFLYVSGHPMAGAVASGFRAAREKMFRGASMILVPGDCDNLQALDTLCGLFRMIGFSKIVTSTPEEHDRMIAFTSQLPHILSNAYVKSPTAQNHRGFSAGSFRDMARVARLNVPMWTELFLENADYLEEELDTMIRNLIQYKEALEAKDEKTLADLLREGAECKAATEFYEKSAKE